MSKLKYVLLSSLFLLSSYANAGNVWTGVKTIVSVQVVETGGFLIGFDSDISPVCSQAGKNRLYVYPDHQGMTQEGLKAFLSASLMAMSAGMKVNVMYDDATPYCWGQHIVVSK